MADDKPTKQRERRTLIPDGPRIAHNAKDRRGERFGRLAVIERAGRYSNESAWLCRCDCGKQKVFGSSALRAGTRSCGCSRVTGKGSRPIYRAAMPPGLSAKRNVLKMYKTTGAKHRGLEWGLSDDEFFALIQQHCTYCGIPPNSIKRVSRNGQFHYNGVDRVDNSRGYVSDNVVTCCSICNHAKCDMPRDAFIEWIRRLTEFQLRANA